MLRKIQIKDTPPEGGMPAAGEHLTIDIHNFIKHYLDENVPLLDQEDRNYYVSFIKKNLMPGNHFAFHEEGALGNREIRNDFSHMFGRALARSITDLYYNVPLFDHAEQYLLDTENRPVYVSGKLLLSTDKDSSHIPYFLCRGKGDEYHLMEGRGKTSPYSKKELEGYVERSNGTTLRNSRGTVIGVKHRTILTQIPFGSVPARCSIIGSQSEGKGKAPDMDSSIFRGHYRKIFANLNHAALSSYLSGTLRHYSNAYKKSYLCGKLLQGGREKLYVIEPITFDFSGELYYRLNYPTEFHTDSIRRRNLVYGLEWDLAALIASESEKSQNDFRESQQYLENIDINESGILGLSNDGSVVAYLNQFYDFSTFEL